MGAITERDRLRVEVLEAQSSQADFGVGCAAGDGRVFTPKSSKQAAQRRNPNPAGKDSPLHNTNDPSPTDTEEGSFIRKSSPAFSQVVEAAFVQCRDDLATDEVPRKMPPRFILPDSPTPATAENFGRAKTPTSVDVEEGFKATTSTAHVGTSTQSTFSTFADGVKKTRSQMDRSPQPGSSQPDRSAQLDRSPTQLDRSPTRPVTEQASISQRVPRDVRESNALHQKASSIFAPTVRKEGMTHPFENSPQGHNVKEPNAMYQKAGAMFGANVGVREAVSMPRSEREKNTNTAHCSATAKFAANVGSEVPTTQRAAQESGDDVNAIYQKAASAMFATGSRDEAARRDEAGTLQGSREVPNAMHQKAAAVIAANAGLKAESSTDVMYQTAAAAYAASTSHLGELGANHSRLLSKAC